MHRQDGMVAHHARAGIAHHRRDPLPHVGLVAVYGTFGTGRLILAERAFVEAFVSIIQKLPAVRAKLAVGPVPIVAVDVDHCPDGLVPSPDP